MTRPAALGNRAADVTVTEGDLKLYNFSKVGQFAINATGPIIGPAPEEVNRKWDVVAVWIRFGASHNVEWSKTGHRFGAEPWADGIVSKISVAKRWIDAGEDIEVKITLVPKV